MTIKLSAALIVKNEEANLKRCLQSVCHVVDEIIIVDTGSTDKTMNIAKGFGAKIYEHPWEDDFSLHRNQSFGYATGDWVLQIDADEQLVLEDQNNPESIKKWLSIVPEGRNAIALRLKDIRQNSVAANLELVRIFRKGFVEYKGIVHNEPFYEGVVTYCPLVHLRHYGYDLTFEQKEKKAKRTIGLLEKRLSDNPDDIDAIFYMAQAIGSYGNTEDAIPWAIKYVEKRKPDEPFNTSIFYFLANSYRLLEDYPEMYKWLVKGLEETPKDVDLCMGVLQYGIHENRKDLIRSGAVGFINAYEDFANDVCARGNRFSFHYNANSYVYAMYQLALCGLEEAATCVEKTEKLSAEVPMRVLHDFRAGLRSNLKSMGLLRI